MKWCQLRDSNPRPQWLDKGIDPRRAVDRLGGGKREVRRPALINAARSTEPPDPNDFATRLAATPKDSVPLPDPYDNSSVLFVAYEYIERWFKAQGKNSKEACRCYG